MSTSVYRGLNPFNLYSQTLSADLLVRCYLSVQLLQFLIHWLCVGDHDTLQILTTKSTYRSLSAQWLSERTVLLIELPHFLFSKMQFFTL